MSRRHKEVERHLSEEELDEVLAEADGEKIVRRLVFIKNLYRGDTIKEAAERVGRSESTGDRWADRWNNGGLDGLPPNFGGGRPPKLDRHQRERLLERLAEGQPWQPREIHHLLDEEFGVEYHSSYLSEFLRTLGLSYSTRRTEDKCAGDAAGGWELDDDR